MCTIHWLHKQNKLHPQEGNAEDLDVVKLMYNLKEYCDDCSKTSGSLWQYYRYEVAATTVNSKQFISKTETTGKMPVAGNTKNVEIEQLFLKEQLTGININRKHQ